MMKHKMMWHNYYYYKNEKIRVTLYENAAGALYIVNKMCVDGLRKMQLKQVNDNAHSN